MAFIRVAYKARKAEFDYVDGNLLDTLIARDEISHFYRPSEKRWVSIKFDTIRVGKNISCEGPERRERRKNQNNLEPEIQRQEKSTSNIERDCANWLERLWKHIETSK